MKHSSIKPALKQTSFLDIPAQPDIARDTPVINLDERVRTVVIDNEQYFSLFDILAIHGSEGSAKNPRVYWQRAKERMANQGVDVVTFELQHRFEGQGQRDTPVINLDGFMRIVQAIDIPEWEPIRDWMAKQSAKALKTNREIKALASAKINQGMSPLEAQDFARQTIVARETRNDWTAALKAAVIGAINYGQATNVEYTNLFGKTAKEIREITGFDVARDGMTTEGRAIVTAVEATMTKMFLRHENLTFMQALDIVRDVCSAYRISVVNVERLLGIDLSTGKPTLQAGTK